MFVRSSSPTGTPTTSASPSGSAVMTGSRFGSTRWTPPSRAVRYRTRRRGSAPASSVLRGGLRTPKIKEVATFGDGATLDVPGSPSVILTPGHTPGSAALHVPSLGALFVGDAFATYAVTTGARGPQVAPFTADAAEAVASLPRLDAVSADLVLPGHGDPWTGGIPEAIRLVREGAAARRSSVRQRERRDA
jgi:glyoxylase-like metal-dependent hydrolase (beta-lactamase superfamily II)